MPEIPNLTDRLAELREHKKSASLKAHERHEQAPSPEPKKKSKPPAKERRKPAPPPEAKPPAKAAAPERRVAFNPLVFGVYTTLVLALIGQVFLIALLDLL